MGEPGKYGAWGGGEAPKTTCTVRSHLWEMPAAGRPQPAWFPAPGLLPQPEQHVLPKRPRPGQPRLLSHLALCTRGSLPERLSGLRIGSPPPAWRHRSCPMPLAGTASPWGRARLWEGREPGSSSLVTARVTSASPFIEGETEAPQGTNDTPPRWHQVAWLVTQCSLPYLHPPGSCLINDFDFYVTWGWSPTLKTLRWGARGALAQGVIPGSASGSPHRSLLLPLCLS